MYLLEFIIQWLKRYNEQHFYYKSLTVSQSNTNIHRHKHCTTI